MVDLIADLADGLPNVLAVGDRNFKSGVQGLSRYSTLSLAHYDRTAVLMRLLLTGGRPCITRARKILSLNWRHKRHGR